MSAIRTFTGIMIDPAEPDSELIDIRDIAHALSLLCRANGHFSHFYSVAQHSLACMREAKARGYGRRTQLACLLHDASEAYLSDVTRPIKGLMPEYLVFEKRLQDMIYEKYIGTLSESELSEVSEADDCMLYYEFLALTGMKLFDTEPRLESRPEFGPVEFGKAESDFLREFEELIRDSAKV